MQLKKGQSNTYTVKQNVYIFFVVVVRQTSKGVRMEDLLGYCHFGEKMELDG